MDKVKVELVLSESEKFVNELDEKVVELMMQSGYVTMCGHTIKVKSTEVTSKGIVRFYGTEASKELVHN